MPALNLSEAPQPWEAVRDFAQAKGWAVELTPRGRTVCRKAGSVVFGPGHGASIDVYKDLIDRLGHVDRFMAQCGRRP
jgi:hypothetical protein